MLGGVVAPVRLFVMMFRAFLLALALATTPALAQIDPHDAALAVRAERPAVIAGRHMVAAANPIAADAGRQMLRAGGSAVDAIIATQLVLTLVEPQSSGVGGGGFLVHYDARTKTTHTIDGRETAPASATDRLFLTPQGKPDVVTELIQGGRAVGIPGMFRLMEAAHKRHGILPWKRLFEPAIAVADNGFAISPRMEVTLVPAARFIANFPAARAYFLDPEGKPWPIGHVLKNPAYARLLRDVARGGADAYYKGDYAKRAAAAVSTSPRHPALMSASEIAGYRAIERPAVCGAYRAYRLCSMGPPSSGATTLLAALALLEPHDLKALGPDSPKAVHLIARALSVAFADRDRYLADPAFYPVPTAGLIDRAYLATRQALIDPDRAGPYPEAGTPPGIEQHALASDPGLPLPATSHMVAVDDRGDVATWTGTVQAPYGSFLLVDGYLLNNELTDFAADPAPGGAPVVNRPEAGKRPRSSMTPTIVFDGSGRPVLALGSAGGSRIIGHVLKTLVAKLDWGLDVQQAINYPNIFLSPRALLLEKSPRMAALRPALEAMGYTVQLEEDVSGAQGIEIFYNVDGQRVLQGGADPRREGVALGD